MKLQRWFSVLFLIAIILARVGLTWILRPLHEIAEHAKEIANRKFGPDMAVPKTLELKSVVQAFNSMSELTIREFSPQTLISRYPHINFDLQIVYQDLITGHYVIFLPDMPHLTNNLVTALELSG